jgi:hypothetical protein
MQSPAARNSVVTASAARPPVVGGQRCRKSRKQRLEASPGHRVIVEVRRSESEILGGRIVPAAFPGRRTVPARMFGNPTYGSSILALTMLAVSRLTR